MSASADLAPGCQVEHCITCGDEAAPMLVRALDRGRGLALCERADGRREAVETTLVEGVVVGDTVLVHAGVALQRAPEQLVAADDRLDSASEEARAAGGGFAGAGMETPT